MKVPDFSLTYRMVGQCSGEAAFSTDLSVLERLARVQPKPERMQVGYP